MPTRILLALFLLVRAAAADPLAVGSELEAFVLPDQHGVDHRVDAEVRAILFAREMEGGRIVKTALEEIGDELLADAGAVYIADVSGMPAIVRRLFALPRMRRRGYPMLLDTEGEVTRDFPGTEGRATLIVLDSLSVAAIRDFETAEDLQSALRSLHRERVPASN